MLTWPCCCWISRDDWEENDALFQALLLRVPAVLVLNKIDGMAVERVGAAKEYFAAKAYVREVQAISALKKDEFAGVARDGASAIAGGAAFF